MSEHEQEHERPNDDLLEEQEGKGYGRDEGEREQALDEEDEPEGD